MTTKSLPIPPLEFRRLVGRPEEPFYDGSTATHPFDGMEESRYRSVFDFGCGAGRLAGPLISRQPRPGRYLGIDRHRGMIDWCTAHLGVLAPEFEFRHHDVLHPQLNPGGTPGHLPLPSSDGDVTLFLAVSVFTHLLEDDAAFYLRELGRVLSPQGVAVATWFLFDKSDYPMMQEFQNALMINPCDLTNAVIFDRSWLVRTADAAGLSITRIDPPGIRGFHWWIYFEKHGPGRTSIDFPLDLAPRGIARPPLG